MLKIPMRLEEVPMKDRRIVERRSWKNRRRNYGHRRYDGAFHNGNLIYLIKNWDCQCQWDEADPFNFDRRQGPIGEEIRERRGTFKGKRGAYRKNRRCRQLKKY